MGFGNFTITTAVICLCLACYVGWVLADYLILWARTTRPIYVFGEVDLYWSVAVLLPLLIGHFTTIWYNYFQSVSQFQQFIAKVISSISSRAHFSFWERHDRWGFNRTPKVWCLAGIIIFLNLYWFIFTTVRSRQILFINMFGNTLLATVRSLAYGASQALLLNTSIILFLVLRRSMLEAAFGLTNKETLPLHRWLGASMVCWAILHASFTLAWLSMTDRLKSDIAFTDKTRGNRDLCGVFALCGLVVLGLFALPKVRRAIYPVYLYVHRCGAFIFLTGLMMHYPTVMLWYYVLPSFILFLLDRFVPRILQAWSLNPTATFTLSVDADIVRIQFNSREPMKPYLPGDFIRIMVPGLGNIYHPFTIASYWPEDPCKMTLFVRVFGNSRLCWTNALAKVCNGNEGPEDWKVANLRVHVDGPYGGRRHDYLKADTVIIFIAGAAITTFMALIKAIAAQIAASPEPSRMQLYLICTFRTCSELHAYGSFLHQITHDPRFTNWLHAEIFVTRSEKREASQGTPTRMANSHTATSNYIATNTAGSSTTHRLLPTVEPEFSPHSEKKATGSMIYDGRPLPTFDNSPISAWSASKRQAKYDLALSFVLVVIPLSVFYGLRAVSWEGSSHWCRTTTDRNSNRTVLSCYWSYALVPGFAHLITFLVLGYSAIYFARRSHRRWIQRERRGADVENNEAVTGAGRESAFGLDDGNWDEGDVPYTRGRMEISQEIQNFLDKGIGCPSSSAKRPVFSVETGETQEPKEGQLGTSGLVAVLAGGPEGFVSMIERQVYKAAWSVEFYRETWTM